MRLLGVTCLEELTPAHVTQLVRLAPRPRLVDHLVTMSRHACERV